MFQGPPGNPFPIGEHNHQIRPGKKSSGDNAPKARLVFVFNMFLNSCRGRRNGNKRVCVFPFLCWSRCLNISKARVGYIAMNGRPA